MKNIVIILSLFVLSKAQSQNKVTLLSKKGRVVDIRYSRGCPPIGYSVTSSYIIVDNSGASEGLNNKQILINLDTSNFNFSAAKSNGDDILFMQHCLALDHYIEKWSDTSAKVWVKVNSIAAATIDTIWLYYGNPSAQPISSYDKTFLKPSQYNSVVSSYNFTEGRGTTLSSSTGGSAATFRGLWDIHPKSKTRYSVRLATEGDYISFPITLTTDGTFGFTWIPTTTQTAGTTANNRVFTMYIDASNSIDAYVDNTDGKLYINYKKAGTVTASAVYVYSWTAGTPYKFAFTWDNTWLRLYVNNVYEDRVKWSPSVNGVSANITLGAFSFGATPSNTMAGRYTDWFQLNKKVSFAEVEALYDSRVYYQKDMASKVQKNYFPDYPLDGIGQNAIAEATVIYEGGKFKLWAANGQNPVYTIYNESTDLIHWGTATTVLGGGANGVAGTANRPCMVKSGSTYYLYYMKGGGDIFMKESSDGVTFPGTEYTTISGTTDGFEGFYNVGVYQDVTDPNTWHMIAEGYKSAQSYKWANSYYRSTTGPRGPFLPIAGTTNPRSTLRFGGKTSNNAQILYVNGQWQVIEHASNRVAGSTSGSYKQRMGLTVTNITPSEHFAFTTTDFNTFTPRYSGQPFMRVEGDDEYDQIGDAHLFTDGNICYMVHDQCNNGILSSPDFYKITFSKIPVTLSQFFKDLSVVVHK